MLLTYETRHQGVSVEWKKSVHVSPHMHEDIEIIYVTDGTVELGIGQELYHMEKGDFAIVFPNVIHHYQVFDSGKNKAIYVFLAPSLSKNHYDKLLKYSPDYPVIKNEQLHVDVVHAVKSMAHLEDCNSMLVQAYMEIILAHVFSTMHMVNKEAVGANDLIYKTVEYVFKERYKMTPKEYRMRISAFIRN